MWCSAARALWRGALGRLAGAGGLSVAPDYHGRASWQQALSLSLSLSLAYVTRIKSYIHEVWLRQTRTGSTLAPEMRAFGMHAFLLALLVTGVAAFGSLPAAHPGNPCLDPNDFIATDSIVQPPYCAVPNAISETKDTCKAAGCYWDEYPDPGSDSCGCGSQQLCESDAVGGTWTVSSFTCGDEGLLNQGWNCASNPGELGWFSGGCCSGGAAASKCNAVCETADCAFNPCKDPNDFDPAASKPDDDCVTDEPRSNPIAKSRKRAQLLAANGVATPTTRATAIPSSSASLPPSAARGQRDRSHVVGVKCRGAAPLGRAMAKMRGS